MSGTHRLHLNVAAALFAAALVTAGANAAPLELYGRLPNLEDVALSPDGSRIAFVRTTANQRGIFIVSLADNRLLGGSKAGEVKLRGIQWADDNHLLITTSATTFPAGLVSLRTEWVGLQVYDVRSKSTTIFPSPLKGVNLMNVISGRIMITRAGGHTALFIPGIYITDRTLPGLFRVDLETYAETLVRQGSEATREWLVNDAGEIVAEQNYFDREQRWSLNVLRDGHLGPVAGGSEAIEYPRILGFGPSGDSVLMVALEGGDPVWRLLSLLDGKFGPPMTQSRTLSEPIEDARTHRMIGGVQRGDDTRYVFFDPQREAQWNSIVGGFAGERLRLVSASDDFKKVIVRVDGHQHGFLYVLVDTDAHKAGVVGEVYEGLGKPLEVRPIAYAAADGLRIPALLTLPDGKPATGLPLIVLPHGGPAEFDSADFDWWSQALAAQGYAVLRPNFRGSALGWGFMSAGFGEWGRKMQTDVSDGVRYLSAQGIVDPARVCIVGGSYGGYAALAGVTLEHGVYRCAVSVAGISDTQRMLKWWAEGKLVSNARQLQRYWDRYLGSTGVDDPVLATISPLRHIDALNVPVLLIHGRDDTVVPFEQSELLYDALRKANKPAEMVTLTHEDHWLSRSETRLQMLQSTVAFLRANNPPD